MMAHAPTTPTLSAARPRAEGAHKTAKPEPSVARAEAWRDAFGAVWRATARPIGHRPAVPRPPRKRPRAETAGVVETQTRPAPISTTTRPPARMPCAAG